MTEIWRQITGFEGEYEVSDHGRVRSLHWSPPRIRTGTNSGHGYLVVNLQARGKKARRCYVHRLVCIAFNGEPPAPRMHVAHLDGDGTNNSSENLAWATAVENASHRKLHGTETLGERHGKSVLKEAQVRDILAHKGKQKSQTVGAMFGVSPRTIRGIWSGKEWAHIERSAHE